MSYRKRTYRVIEKAELRLAKLNAIDPNMDFGDARNLKNLTQLIEELRTKIDAYNKALEAIQFSRAEIKELEKTLNDLSERMLLGIAFKYGTDSREYSMAGGVRKSDRIRKSRLTRLKASSKKASTKNA
ncbi:hypothetical protein [aff. Roholtiella sp. LEGE 12411]|uniref:hypothetical protein n=1 Tax=aff. Roholtiella sp. LEGE 12411 TaxID=1828822 RepID=UPI00187ECCE7|nr:hypothetical protein [aff. Roholtiella sp. LEGE 12411]